LIRLNGLIYKTLKKIKKLVELKVVLFGEIFRTTIIGFTFSANKAFEGQQKLF
jgi:hypothetical protein